MFLINKFKVRNPLSIFPLQFTAIRIKKRKKTLLNNYISEQSVHMLLREDYKC